MALRQHGGVEAARAYRKDLMDAAVTRAEVATNRAMRRFLRRVLAQVATTLAGDPALTAAGEPMAHDLFTLGQARGWWDDAVSTDLMPALQAIWTTGYADTSTVSSGTDAAAGYLARVFDRLVPDCDPQCGPALPSDAFNTARVALTQELAAGSSIPKISQRLAAEFSWDDQGKFWRAAKADAQAQIDAILDPLGAPGDYAREQAKRNDPRVVALREESNLATSHIDAAESLWKTRATLIARTESTGAMNAGAYHAYGVEGVTAVRWLATLDSRTRPSHAAADGQIRKLGEAFEVGGAAMMFPGDPSGPIRQSANCRCSTIGSDVDPTTATPAAPRPTTTAAEAEAQSALQATVEAAAKLANERARQAALQAKMEAAAARANEAAAAARAAAQAEADLALAAQKVAAAAEAEATALAAKVAAEAAEKQGAAKLTQLKSWRGQPAPVAPTPPVAKFGTPKRQFDLAMSRYADEQERWAADHAAWKAANEPAPGPALLGMKGAKNRSVTWANQTMRRFTGQDAAAIVRYTGDSFKPWNNALRKAAKAGTDPRAHARYGGLTERLDAALEASPLPESIRVHRATSTKEFAFPPGTSPDDLTKLIGTTQVQDGFLSTSVGTKSAFGGDVHITFVAPEGTPMAWVEPLSKFAGENEMLGARGLKYLIHDVKFNREKQQWQVNAEILPVTPRPLA